MAWDSILGHDVWVKAFDHVVRLHRLAHAYLFVGPVGVGKRLFAHELAKALLCENSGDRLQACDACPSCHLVPAQTHPDLFLVRRPEDKNELPVDAMRDLTAQFSLKTMRGRGKVAIIEDADDLNEESSNSFLKTLEEPPPRSVLILIGSSLDRQLPTIRSRCQTVRFAPLPEALVRQIVQQHSAIAPELLESVMRLAQGSPGQALLLADPPLWEFRSKLLYGLAQPKVATVELAREFIGFVEEAGKEAPAQRRRAAQVLRVLLGDLKDALTLRLSDSASAPSSETGRLLQALAQRLTPEQFLRLMDRCLEAPTQIDRYVQVSLVLEGLLEGLTQIIEAHP